MPLPTILDSYVPASSPRNEVARANAVRDAVPAKVWAAHETEDRALPAVALSVLSAYPLTSDGLPLRQAIEAAIASIVQGAGPTGIVARWTCAIVSDGQGNFALKSFRGA